MMRAVLRLKDGTNRITVVRSEPDSRGGYIVNNYISDGSRVFKLSGEINGRPLYVEIEQSYEEFYGYEKEEKSSD